MRREKGVRRKWGHHCESASGKGNTKTLLRPPKDKAASLKSCQETKKDDEQSQKEQNKRKRTGEEGGRKGQWKKKRSSRMKANVLAKRKVGFNGCGLGGD